jgi:hypothetical protein
VLAALLLLAQGRGQEPDELALARVLGVDGAGTVTVTAVCGGDDQQDGSRAACGGADLTAALAELPWAGGEQLALTNVSYIIVGPEADLEGVLRAVLDDRALSATATVWFSPAGAETLLDDCDDPAAYLALLTRQGAGAPTAARALAALYTQGAVALPRLEAQDGLPRWTGETVWEVDHGG